MRRTMTARQIAEAEAGLARYYAAREAREEAARKRDAKLARVLYVVSAVFTFGAAVQAGAVMAGIGA